MLPLDTFGEYKKKNLDNAPDLPRGTRKRNYPQSPKHHGDRVPNICKKDREESKTDL